jgi:predicted nucleic acid-binding protein
LAEIVVADAGPLIALGRLRGIEVLPRVFERILVPRAVFLETQARPSLLDAQAIDSARERGLFVVEETSPDLKLLPPGAELGEGEAVAIALAAARGHGVLIDEKLGRTVAEALNLKVIGTVGVLVIARRRALIPALKPLLEQLKSSGYRLSDELIQQALRLAGE